MNDKLTYKELLALSMLANDKAEEESHDAQAFENWGQLADKLQRMGWKAKENGDE
jgi:hypothetical protein